MTRADAVSIDSSDGQNLYVIHEHKSKWSPRPRAYKEKVMLLPFASICHLSSTLTTIVCAGSSKRRKAMLCKYMCFSAYHKCINPTFTNGIDMQIHYTNKRNA